MPPHNNSWSSYREYLGVHPQPPWLHTDRVLTEFGVNRRASRYWWFVERNNESSLLEHYVGEPAAVTGSEAFIAELVEDVEHDGEVLQATDVAARPSRDAIVRLLASAVRVDERGMWFEKRLDADPALASRLARLHEMLRCKT